MTPRSSDAEAAVEIDEAEAELFGQLALRLRPQRALALFERLRALFDLFGDVSRDSTRATMVLENTLEQVRNISPSNLMSANLSVTDGPGVSRTIQVKVVNGSGTWITLPSAGTSIGSLPNPVEAQVTIIWRDERGHVFSRSASTKVPR